MKNMKLLCSLVLLACLSVSGTAHADRGRGGHARIGLGFYFGAP